MSIWVMWVAEFPASGYIQVRIFLGYSEAPQEEISLGADDGIEILV
jgi:hypothetical protein